MHLEEISSDLPDARYNHGNCVTVHTVKVLHIRFSNM